MNQYTTYLFAQPSFLEGMARSLDLSNTLNQYNRSSTEVQADYLALLSDWQVVGMELQSALVNSVKPQR